VVDILVQRDEWPAEPVRAVGAAANAGLVYVRSPASAARRERVVRFLMGAVERGLVEFYLRWNNIPDQYGWSFMLAQARGLKTTLKGNETAIGLIHPRGSHCKRDGSCLRVGLLPYDLFPRTGSWEALKARAHVYHLTYACIQEMAPCSTPGVRTFRGHRQRLDRYEQVDFDEQRSTMRQIGLWRLDGNQDQSDRRVAAGCDASARRRQPRQTVRM
jgi:hypothetical protein